LRIAEKKKQIHAQWAAASSSVVASQIRNPQSEIRNWIIRNPKSSGPQVKS